MRHSCERALAGACGKVVWTLVQGLGKRLGLKPKPLWVAALRRVRRRFSMKTLLSRAGNRTTSKLSLRGVRHRFHSRLGDSLGLGRNKKIYDRELFYCAHDTSGKQSLIMSTSIVELLEMAAAAHDFLGRPTLAKALGLGMSSEVEVPRRSSVWVLQRERLLERIVRGDEIGWRITAAGRRRLAELRDAPRLRQRPWDGRWRLVMFDVPEVSRKQRDAFRWWLRLERLGQLQKSVWVSPYPLSDDLERFLRDAARLNWILWFESPEKGPIADVEIARRAWPLADLAGAYGKYLAEFSGRLRALEQAPASFRELARWRVEENAAHGALLDRDPFLPKQLLPAEFHGAEADELHQRFVRSCVRRLERASGGAGAQ